MKAQWERGQRDGPELVDQVTALVSEWTYATAYAGREHLQPFWHERNGLGRGRLLRAAPSKQRDFDEYGLDRQGRIVLARRHYGGELWRYCCLYSSAEARFFDFSGDGSLREIGHYSFQGQRLGEAVAYSAPPDWSWSRELYRYDDDRLVEIRVAKDYASRRWAPEEPEEYDWSCEFLDYAADGELLAIRGRHRGVGEFMGYQRPEPRPSSR